MPLRGYVCPQGADEPGRRNDVAYCLHHCTNPCVAPSLLASMYKADVGNYHVGDYISASMLAGNNCTRQTVLERFEPLYELPRKRYWSFRGTIIHKVVEEAYALLAPGGWLQEIRTESHLDYPDKPAPIFEDRTRELAEWEREHLLMLQQLERAETLERLEQFHELLNGLGVDAHTDLRDGWIAQTLGKYSGEIPTTVTESVWTGAFDANEILRIKVKGTGDAYNPYRRIYADTKSMADKKAEMTVRGEKGGSFSKNLEDAHVWQFNIYRWLFARTPIPQKIRDQFAAAGLPAIKSKNFPAPTKLWMQGIGMMDLPRSGTKYPLKGEYGKVTIYDIDDIPTLPLTEIEAYVRPQALYWFKHLRMRIPAGVVGADRQWMCNGCAFNGEVIAGERCMPKAERAAAKAKKAV